MYLLELGITPYKAIFENDPYIIEENLMEGQSVYGVDFYCSKQECNCTTCLITLYDKDKHLSIGEFAIRWDEKKPDRILEFKTSSFDCRIILPIALPFLIEEKLEEIQRRYAQIRAHVEKQSGDNVVH